MCASLPLVPDSHSHAAERLFCTTGSADLSAVLDNKTQGDVFRTEAVASR